MRDEIQWLRIGELIRFELSILVHKCLNNSAPPYLIDKIRPLSTDYSRSQLRYSKSSDVFVPRTKTKMGDRAFQVAGPPSTNLEQPSWNYSGNQNPSCFKKQLKLYLISNPEH